MDEDDEKKLFNEIQGLSLEEWEFCVAHVNLFMKPTCKEQIEVIKKVKKLVVLR